MRTKNYRILLVSVFIFLCLGVNVLAQEFPVNPINLYIGYAPGGGATHTGTIIAEGMKKYLKQPVFLNFKPGATQAIAAEFIINSKPDGYTLFWVSLGELITKFARDGSILKFRLEDLDALGCGPYSPYILAVNASSPFKTIEDFIAAAKKSPGKLNYGSAGAGSPTHMLAELFAIKAGIALNHIPFSGGSPAITALLGKHTNMSIMSGSSFGAHIKTGGGLRPLTVFDQRRVPDLLDVPTALEKGIDITMAAWYGLSAPKGMPKGIRATLIQGFKNTVEDSEANSMLGKMVGVKNAYLTPEETDKKIQEEYKILLEVIKKAGLGK